MWGATIFDQLVCRILFHRMRYEGPFTPPSLQGTLVFPGNLGMFEWGGIAVDPVRQIAVANPIAIPFVSKLIPRGPDNPEAPNAAHPTGSEIGVQPMYGAPYGVVLHPFLSPLGIPCKQPPWGFMAGIDLKTMTIVWMHRNGTIRDSAPLPVPIRMGVPSLGGPLTTAGGVAFLTSTADYYIRAYDVRNGDQLWQDRLPAGGQSTPMSYAIGGKQFVVTAAGGMARSAPSRATTSSHTRWRTRCDSCKWLIAHSEWASAPWRTSRDKCLSLAPVNLLVSSDPLGPGRPPHVSPRGAHCLEGGSPGS
jgi:quinoprotein glucose dehydrogenase